MMKMAYMDASRVWQLGFQDPATPIAEGIVRFHHDLMAVLVMVSMFVAWMMSRSVSHFHEAKGHMPSMVVHGTMSEVVWTIIPASVLVAIAVPSFALLYSVDESVSPVMTVKIVGHQWYWSYEYSDVEGDSSMFDSYMLPEDESVDGGSRLYEVDNRMVIPIDTHIRLLITAADVLHCWAVPSFGVKSDACPGRLNQVSSFVTRPGVYYGQCSEICGVNHGFMPIAVEASTMADYTTWLVEMTNS